MGISLVTSAPAWTFLLCLAAGFAYAFLLYRNSPLPEISRLKVNILFALRFVVVSAIAFLLMSPLVKTTRREIEKPIVVLATDASSSMVSGKDSLAKRALIEKDLNILREGLSEDFDLRILQFGDHVTDGTPQSFDHKATDFTQLFEEVDVRYSGRNTGALILMTDGGFNRGASPAYGPRRLQLPVFSLAYGDTSVRKDLAIGRIRNNRMAYLGNSFPLEIAVDADMLSGTSSELVIREDSTVLHRQSISISGSKYHSNLSVYIEARKTGIRHYTIELTPIGGEVTTENNKRDVFIEVVEDKVKVLLLAVAPHPDLSAIRTSLESGLNHQVETSLASEFKGTLGNYDLLILHGFPVAGGSGNGIAEKILNSGVPRWFILSAGSSLSALRELGVPVAVQQYNGQLNDVQAVSGNSFSLFSPREELLRALNDWPPLKSPFGVYSALGGSSTWLNQKVGSVASDQPLLTFGDYSGVKTAVLCGEGIWKWRMADYLDNGSHELSQEFVQQVVRYLSSQEEKGPFRVQCKSDFRETEAITFDAQLFNASGQLVNEPDVRVAIRGTKGTDYTYTMNRTSNTYQLSAGLLPVGRYTWSAEVKLGDNLYKRQGQFSISALQLEQAGSRANHDPLRILASRTSGEVFSQGNAAKLVERIRDNKLLKPVSYLRNSTEELLNEFWFFLLVVLLLGGEWLIRKLSGGY
ncbi:MAG: hypothetical protein ACK5CT_06410 [Bacteroidota bacterium]|jgi:hypothetical protein